jgi:DNA-binding MarR family transcriptional regulator
VDHVEAVRAVVRMSRLLERASGDLSLAHYRVLAAIADGDERASHVAARLALGKPTISASVDALCGRGLLRREPGAGDQRVSTLRLTPAGAAALHESETAMLARLDAVLIRTADAPDVVVALGRLAAGLDALAAERLTSPA